MSNASNGKHRRSNPGDTFATLVSLRSRLNSLTTLRKSIDEEMIAVWYEIRRLEVEEELQKREARAADEI